MTFEALMMAFYTFVALRFLDCTLREGGVRGGWDLHRILGLLLCLVWPATLAGVAFVAYQQRRNRLI
ncbi:MAG: hypothetical protein QHC90_17640 [Shinella sp.]|nr:hypothetical protein [Shinella sp.]